MLPVQQLNYALLAITWLGDEIVSGNNLYAVPMNFLIVEEQEATGVKQDYIRLSIGIEDIEDLIADLE